MDSRIEDIIKILKSKEALYSMGNGNARAVPSDCFTEVASEIVQLHKPQTENTPEQMHDHINEMLAPVGLCLYRLTPTNSADDYGLADKDGDPIDIESVLKPAMDNYYKVDEPQPDQSSRLLTDDDELELVWNKAIATYIALHPKSCNVYEREHLAMRAIRDKTASIKDAEIKELQTKLDEWQLGFEHFLTTNHKLVKKIIATHIEALGSSIRRFWAKVEVCTDGCWEWRGATNGKGYGQFWNGDKAMPAHRFLYELFIKKVEDDLELDHLCRNLKCVNPSHLEAVTHRENLRRGMGRQHWLSKTHCKHGHPFNEENTYTRPGTIWRDCRICHKRWSRETRLRKSLERIEALKANPTSEVEG